MEKETSHENYTSHEINELAEKLFVRFISVPADSSFSLRAQNIQNITRYVELAFEAARCFIIYQNNLPFKHKNQQ